MADAARLVDELTTLLYEVRTGWQDSAGGHQIVRCGACRRHADRAESVVHDSDCPVYRLHRAEAANTAVIRANADEIADLEDVRDDLEAKVNALTAENARLARQVAALREASQRVIDCIDHPLFFSPEALRASPDVAALRLALAATARAERAEGERDRTQQWLDRFQSEAATQQVRAIKAEQTAEKDRAAVTNQVAVLTDAGERLYGQAMTFAIQFHVSRGHTGLFDSGACGVGACLSTLKQMAAWRAALAEQGEG